MRYTRSLAINGFRFENVPHSTEKRYSWLTVEILDTLLPERVHWNNQASC